MLDNVLRSFSKSSNSRTDVCDEADVVRVFVQKCNGLHQPESRKFSFDARVTNNTVLRMLLVKAFGLHGQQFAISYLSKDERGRDVYLTLLSDYDLKLALKHACNPALRLKVDCSPFSTKTNCLDDWDIIQSSDVSYHRSSPHSPGPTSESTKLLSTLPTPFEDTFNRFQRVLNINEKREQSFKYLVPPLKDADFHEYLDSEGRLIRSEELRLMVYQIGVEHSLRKVVWKHLLNVYPTGLTGAQRIEYMRAKCDEYELLKRRWQGMDWELKRTTVTSIRKDVLRTDRSHAFYTDLLADFEQTPTNPHLTSLFDILMTFAMSFPHISYCQGMSDLASPLLLIMQDEATTYVCFCALMNRLKGNFTLDSHAMRIKFDHLKLLLKYVDMEFYNYLSNGVDNFELFFCYRWLLLEMKREFALDDALLMLEVMWASIPPDPPDHEVVLSTDAVALEVGSKSALSRFSPRKSSQDSSGVFEGYHLNPLDADNDDLITWSKEENQKPKHKDLNFDHLSNRIDRRQDTSCLSSPTADSDSGKGAESPVSSFCSDGATVGTESDIHDHQSPRPSSSPAHISSSEGLDSQESTDTSHSMSSPARKHHRYVPNGTSHRDTSHIRSRQKSTSSSSMKASTSCPRLGELSRNEHRGQSDSVALSSSDASLDEDGMPATPVDSCCTPVASTAECCGSPAAGLSPDALKRAQSNVDISPNCHKKTNVFSWDVLSSDEVEEADPNKLCKQKVRLPCPADFGCGNPFLLFMCVTLIIQQKQSIISQNLDFVEVSAYFYRLVRSHDVHRVLGHARMLFADYLRTQPWNPDSDETDSEC